MWKHMHDAPAPTLRSPDPSPQDIGLSRALVKAGKLLDIEVLDHLIIGANTFVSLNRRGLGFDD